MTTATDAPPTDALRRGLQQLGLALTEDTIGKLDAYLDLIVKWNAVHNLTAIRDKARMVTHHLLDSLAVAPHVPMQATLLDAGSGAGLPGIPLALARPDLVVTLLDSNQKKAAFLQQAVSTLNLGNAAVACERLERYQPRATFDFVISRAFAELADFVVQARHLVAPSGRLFAMKGQYPEAELRRLPSGVELERAIELHIPQLDASRHLLMLRPQ